MLHVACCLWDANGHSQSFSRCYDETWAEKLYRGFKRNLTQPFRFVCFVDYPRAFDELEIDQEILEADEPNYGCMIEPFKLNEPTIICGLDTVILQNIDHMAEYCLSGEKIAVPKHPSLPDIINPVVLVPKGHRAVFDSWNGENDMQWMGKQGVVFTDTMWPGQILSLKMHDIRRKGPQGARIVYFHGDPKPPALMQLDWVKENWV